MDEESGLVHHVECTAANVADLAQVHKLLHGPALCIEVVWGWSGPAKNWGCVRRWRHLFGLPNQQQRHQIKLRVFKRVSLLMF